MSQHRNYTNFKVGVLPWFHFTGDKETCAIRTQPPQNKFQCLFLLSSHTRFSEATASHTIPLTFSSCVFRPSSHTRLLSAGQTQPQISLSPFLSHPLGLQPFYKEQPTLTLPHIGPVSGPSHRGLNNYKTTNPKCRLYWCIIEFIDWIYSQAC